MKVLMVVANPGSNDLRVVKAAESITEKGGQCVVLGIGKNNFLKNELRNGVYYHRVQLRKVSLSSYLNLSHLFSRHKRKRYDDVFELRRKLICPETFSNVSKNSDEEPTLGFRDKEAAKNSGISARHLGRLVRFILKSIFRILNWTFSKIKVFQWDSLFGTFIHALVVYQRQEMYRRAFYQPILDSEADIIHCHELWPLESCALAKKDRWLVYDSHELELHRNTLWPKLSKKIIGKYERKYIGWVDTLIAVSNGCGKQLKREYDLKNYVLVRNMPKLNMQKASSVKIKDSLGLDPSVKLLVYTGNLTFNRGLEEVILALPHLPDEFHLACVGNKRRDIFDEINEIAKNVNVQRRLHFVDAVDPSILIDFISGGDISVVPIKNVCLSYFHCLPNKLFEGLHAGLPVLCSDFPDMAEIVLGENIGLVDSMTNPRSIATKIQRLDLQAPSFYGGNKLQELKQKYKFESDFNDIYKIYHAVVSGA